MQAVLQHTQMTISSFKEWRKGLPVQELEELVVGCGPMSVLVEDLMLLESEFERISAC